MNPLARFHLALALWNLSWAAFWLSGGKHQIRRSTTAEDTAPDTIDRWLRERVRR